MANPTTNLNITLPVPGSSSSKGTWGETINNAVQSLDTGIAERGVPAGGTDNQMLTKNGTSDYSTQWTSAVTATTITATGATTLDGNVTVLDGTNDLDVASHDGTNGLKLGGVLVEATAAELNILAGETDIATQSEVDARVGAAITAAQGLGTGNTVSFVRVNSDVTGDLTGNADTATALETARTIGGVSFNGTANINLPGVNTAGNQNTTGNSATTTALATARNIGGVSFDGTANIDLPGVNASGTQNTSGTAATATNVTVASESVASSQTITNQHNVDSTALFSCANHGLAEDQPIIITLSGTGPTNVTSGTIYYVRPGVNGQFGTGLGGTANNFKISTSPGGSSISSSGTSWQGSANHTFEKVRYPLFALSPTGDLPAKSGGGVTLTSGGKLTATSFSGPLTGDLTGTASGIADGIVSEAKMQISNAPTNGHVLTARSGNTGGMTWEAAGGSFEPAGNSIAMAIALGIVLIPLLG